MGHRLHFGDLTTTVPSHRTMPTFQISRIGTFSPRGSRISRIPLYRLLLFRDYALSSNSVVLVPTSNIPSKPITFWTPRTVLRHLLIKRNSVAECVSTLAGKPFGEYDEVWADNIVCRTVHIILALVRPDVGRFSRQSNWRTEH